ncbi:MAG TPA: histidine kinase [Candidatus Limnocylindria bacterium]|jgi:two-component sensor histidine kinase|nr:histidine kinase [Candidatus Limnocylindria bacterium]
MWSEAMTPSGENSVGTAGPGGTGTAPSPSRPRRILWLGVLGWTVLVGLILWWLTTSSDGPSVWVFQEQDLKQPGFSQKVRAIFRGELRLQRTYPWILFGPYLALMAWYFPLERARLARNLPLNVLACAAFIGACQVVNLQTEETQGRLVVVDTDPAAGRHAVTPGEDSAAGRPVGNWAGSDRPARFSPLPGDFLLPPARKVSLRSMILDLLAYGAATGLVHSVNFHRRLRERERRALVLESHLARARLQMLKAQLQPHFLFNSLNAITALLRRDPRQAEATLVALSELLRLALSQSDRQEGTLREELEFVRRYLEIQQTRFGDKLRVERDIELQTLDCQVPTLVLQPLVENAIRHGIEPADTPGVVRVRAARHEGKLVLTVEDDGVGLPTSSGRPEDPDPLHPARRASVDSPRAEGGRPGAGTGIGLANLRNRLLTLYGARQKLELSPGATGGVIVRVEIPWQPPAASETADPSEV